MTFVMGFKVTRERPFFLVNREIAILFFVKRSLRSMRSAFEHVKKKLRACSVI